MTESIRHLTTPSELLAGIDEQAHHPARLAADGFVHCSDPDITLTVADSYMSSVHEPVLVLDIDPSLLTVEMVREAPAPIAGGGSAHRTEGRTFPHPYGPIDRAAVIRVGTLVPTSAGFAEPIEWVGLPAALAAHDPEATERDAFRTGAQSIIAILGFSEVAERWDEPSVLDGLTIGGLAAHLGRAISTVNRCLATPVTCPADTDAAGYFATLLDVDADSLAQLNAAIAERSVEAAEVGASGAANEAVAALADLEAVIALDAPDRLVTAFGPLTLSLDAYLDTRIVEMAVHLDDLHLSLFGAKAPVPVSVAVRSVATLAEVARRRHGTGAAIAALARSERRGSDPFFAI